jgi:hypothetical protein
MQMSLCYWLREKNGATVHDRVTEIGRCYGMEVNVE